MYDLFQIPYRRYRVRRYRRRPSGRVYTTNGRTARFVKAPSYKNLAFKGNERSGVLREIKYTL